MISGVDKMAVSSREDRRLVSRGATSGQSNNQTKRKRIVLEEDEFISAIDAIIERDFFPDIPKMRRQLEAYDQESTSMYQFIYGNMGQQKQNQNIGADTPSTFGTPLVEEGGNRSGIHDERKEIDDYTPLSSAVQQSSNRTRGHESTQTISGEMKKPPTELSLNDFLAKYTSEDDASFEDIMIEAEKRHRAKHPWLYLKESESNKSDHQSSLALPSAEQQQALGGPEGKREALTWPYKNINSLMFVPEQSPLVKESDYGKFKRPMVVHENTRFNRHPFNEPLNKAMLTEAAISNSREREGRIGIDGKEVVADGPRIGGYSFVSMTPSPMPGVNSTPLMTWGQIDGTPAPLSDGDETPSVCASPRTPHFIIPNVPERDQIAQDLVDRISKRNRERKKAQSQYFQSSPLMSTSGRSMQDSLGSMSPAARRLATSKLGIDKFADSKLRESYSPRISR